MKSVTLSLDDVLLDNAKSYAAGRGLSLNAFVKSLIEKELKRPASDWLDSFFETARAAGANSKGEKLLTREEIYNR